MVICHCLVVNDKAISELAAAGDLSVDDVVGLCGAGSQCGGCHDAIAKVLDAARARKQEQGTAVALAR